MSTHRKTLCVDFDGVIHAYTSGWQGIDKVSDGPTPGAVKWLHWAVRHYDVCVYSSRSKDPKGVAAMKNAIQLWAYEDGLTRDQVSVIMCSLTFPTQKPSAWLTIDDRAICFDGQWPTSQQIDNFQPWNKRAYPLLYRKILIEGVAMTEDKVRYHVHGVSDQLNLQHADVSCAIARVQRRLAVTNDAPDLESFITDYEMIQRELTSALSVVGSILKIAKLVDVTAVEASSLEEHAKQHAGA